MNKNLDNILANMHRQAGGARSEGFDHFDAGAGDFDNVANFLVLKGYPRDAANAMARDAMAKPAVLATIRNAMGGQGLTGLSADPTVGNADGMAAQLKVTVTRVTANIDEALPFAIFGVSDAQNGYRRALQGLLAAGTVLTSVDIGEGDAQPEAALFTYTKGADVDTIKVECQAAPYPAVLQATLVDTFAIDKVRVKLSDKTQTGQFEQALNVLVRNMWGRTSSNNLTPSDFFSPEQFQEGVIDVNANVKIDKETFFQSQMIPVAGFFTSYSLTVRKYAAWRA